MISYLEFVADLSLIEVSRGELGIWQVTYNGENRPVRWELVSSNSNTPNSNTQTLLQMSYDHMGRRRTKNAQRFFYDGYLQIANFHSQPQPLTSSGTRPSRSRHVRSPGLS